MLVRPYDTTFMYYETMTGSGQATPTDVLEWLTNRLSESIETVGSPAELRREWMDFDSRQRHPEQVRVVIVCSSPVPLFLAVLRVGFEGRVGFVRVSLDIASEAEIPLPASERRGLSVVVVTPELTYVYGNGGRSECMTGRAVRLLLSSLAPSAADLLDLAVTASLLLLCLEPCLVCSGIKSRLFGVVRFSIQLCLLFLLYSFFVSYVIPEHELHLLLEGFLPIWRYLALTRFGDLVRSDWLQYTTLSFDLFLVTYFAYLLLVAWLYRWMSRRRKAWLISYWEDAADSDEEKEYIDWYTWKQFGVPDFWLELRLETSGRSPTVGGDVSELSGTADVHSCVLCQGPLSFGSKVCRPVCGHLFHRGCLAGLIHSLQYLCPQCQSPIFDTTSPDSDFSSAECTAELTTSC